MARPYEQLTVAGLGVTEWPAAPVQRGAPVPTVLGVHGLTSTAWVWTHLADELPGHRIIAPDLRGRGRSAGLPGPSGLRAHAKDVAAVVEQLDLRDLVVVGHSMGAFLAPMVAQELGDRVTRLVLVDGGPRPALPAVVTRSVTRLAFRSKLKKLEKDYPSPEAFVDRIGKKLIANRPDLRAALIDVLDHDLVQGPKGYRALMDTERCLDDAVDCFFNPEVQQAFLGVTVPAHLIAASAGEGDKAKAFLSDAVVDGAVRQVRTLTAERVTANHLTMLWLPEIAKAVAG
ncbi:MAG TPA: alpha/beta hydrolase [Mycobacteriales bacterium]|nr:alpha/beta hydrolase [Mycobacteriales bacterium]